MDLPTTLDLIRHIGKITAGLMAGAMGIRILFAILALTMGVIENLTMPKQQMAMMQGSIWDNITIKHFLFFGIFSLFLALAICL